MSEEKQQGLTVTNLAFLVTSESVFIFMPAKQGIAQDAWGWRKDFI